MAGQKLPALIVSHAKKKEAILQGNNDFLKAYLNEIEILIQVIPYLFD